VRSVAEKDDQGNVVHKIELGEEWRKPDEGPPQFGTRRLVRLIPTPVGAFPAIWTAPSDHRGRDGKPCRNVVLLISKTPSPQVMGAEVNSDGIDQFPLVPCEW